VPARHVKTEVSASGCQGKYAFSTRVIWSRRQWVELAVVEKKGLARLTPRMHPHGGKQPLVSADQRISTCTRTSSV
jgi:hypothetical protein